MLSFSSTPSAQLCGAPIDLSSARSADHLIRGLDDGEGGSAINRTGSGRLVDVGDDEEGGSDVIGNADAHVYDVLIGESVRVNLQM